MHKRFKFAEQIIKKYAIKYPIDSPTLYIKRLEQRAESKKEAEEAVRKYKENLKKEEENHKESESILKKEVKHEETSLKIIDLYQVCINNYLLGECNFVDNYYTNEL